MNQRTINRARERMRAAKAKTLTGWDAIEYARAHDLMLSKYNDPTEAAREGLSLEEAEDIAREDPALIYLGKS